MRTGSAGAGPSLPVERVAAGLLLVAYAVWLLLLPAWPSQDGPVHLYFTEVLGKLLAHGAGPDARYFSIKHLLPPYALYYYLLLAMSRVVPLLVADKLVVCLYLVLFLSGFHALARTVAPAGSRGADRATLLATVVLLNWPLGMGFVNYCLSLALGLWAMAVWFGQAGPRPARRVVLFLVLVVLITLAHPVPLLLVLGMCGLDLLARRWRLREYGPLRGDLVAFGLALLPLVYVKAFAARHLLAQRSAELPFRARVLARVQGYVQGRSVGVVFGHSVAVEVYRAGLFLVLLLALTAGCAQLSRHVRQRQLRVTDLFLGAALFLLVVLPLLPSDISGAYYFPERLVLVVWVFALLAAAGWQPSAVATRANALSWALVVATCGVTLALLVAADAALRPRAMQARRLERAPLFREGDRVLVLESTVLPPPRAVTPSWNPEYWMAVHAVRADGAVLANAPWLDSAIIPLAALPDLPAARLAPELANSPKDLRLALSDDANLARQLLDEVEAAAFDRAEAQPAAVPDAVLSAGGLGWRCLKTQDGGTQVCRRLP